MERIRVRGPRLYAGRRQWRAWGMNWGLGDHYPILRYFDDATPARLGHLTRELRTARSMGANSMRIYLELRQVMESAARTRSNTLTALEKLLAMAEREGVYLDITGNVVWRPERAPRWYDELSRSRRWQVQARFWQAVAHAAAASPAVLCYELTSEPVVAERRGYYLGELEGWTFVQSIATARGGDRYALAREWTHQLGAAVRSEDSRPVSIGLLPVTDGPFAPGNVADLLDMLVVHEYPQPGKASESVALVRSFAAAGKPVLLGETFIGDAVPVLTDVRTEREFLLGANPYLVGVFSFFDGRHPDHIAISTRRDELYRSALLEFMALRRAILHDPDS